MEKRRPVDVVVVGGHAGAAIGHLLPEQGRRVVVIASNRKGATDGNQKWLHSGLLYPSGQLAERAWATRNLDWNANQSSTTRATITGLNGADNRACLPETA
jgi:glycine/D-amino acid oxidase-like deaminating enzyme